MWRTSILLVLLVACGGNNELVVTPSAVHCDGGCNYDKLCTTSACAAAPCTAHCLYQLRGSGCPSTLPVTVLPSVIDNCNNACSALVPQSSDQYDPIVGGFCSAPIAGCVVPWCTYSGVCYDFTDGFQTGQAVICPSAANCQFDQAGGGEDASLY